ncbi:MAG: anhydro-N-acetylmuramic acid kinase [Pseudomonadota bacterium]
MDGVFVGLMSGTSVDAVDTIAVRWTDGQHHILGSQSHGIPQALRRPLLDLSRSHSVSFDTLYALDAEVALLHADATEELLKQVAINRHEVLALGFHGQTVYHAPNANHPFTVQLGDPNRLAAATGIAVVADVRRADMAIGGQGAPLAPAIHADLFQSDVESRAVLNLGGIANLTLLPAASRAITGFDTGPANALIDAWCEAHCDRPYDQNGELAASGTVDAELLQRMLDTAFFRETPPKSTGREVFNIDWVTSHIGDEPLSHSDLLATLVELTAITVVDALRREQRDCQSVIVCGGGRHNSTLMARLAELAPCEVVVCEAHEVDGDTVEALLMAWLARQRLAGRAANIPSVTGARASTPLGGLYLPPDAAT